MYQATTRPAVSFWPCPSFCFVPFLTHRFMLPLTLTLFPHQGIMRQQLLSAPRHSEPWDRESETAQARALQHKGSPICSTLPLQMESEYFSHPTGRAYTIFSPLVSSEINMYALSWQKISNSAVGTGNRCSSFHIRYGQEAHIHSLMLPAYHNSDQLFCYRKQNVFSGDIS